jgi:hypothetical protein
MGETQKRVLGVAYTVNAHTQGGVARVRSTTPSARWPDDTVLWDGPADFGSDLGMFAVYGVIPNPRPVVTRVDHRGWDTGYEIRSGRVLWSARHDPAARSAAVAVCKAINSLIRRGMMRRTADSDDARYQSRYCVLTAAGLELGRAHAAPVPEIDLAVRVFLATGSDYSGSGWTAARDELLRRLRPAPEPADEAKGIS